MSASATEPSRQPKSIPTTSTPATTAEQKKSMANPNFSKQRKLRDKLALCEDEEFCDEHIRLECQAIQDGWTENERHRRMVVGHPERVEITVVSPMGYFVINKETD